MAYFSYEEDISVRLYETLENIGKGLFFGKFESHGPEKLTASAILAKFEEQVYGGNIKKRINK